MGFDKGTIPNGTVVPIALLAVVGFLLVGATPAAAQTNETADDGPPEFDFDIDDGADFGFSGDNSSGDEPTFDFGDIGDESSFDFSGIGEDGEGSDFSGIGEDGDAPDFSGIGEGSEGSDFSGIGEDGDAPDFSGIGEDGDTPDFGGIGDDGGDGKDDGDNGNETEPADFRVSNLDAPTEATVGDTITVSANVENVGGSEGTQSVAFGVDTDDDGELEEITSRDETLTSGASTTVTFDVDTSDFAAGTYTHGVSTANDTAEAEITLASQQTDQPANFQIQNIETNSPVTEGENVTVEATIENTGDEEGTQRLRISFFGTTDRPVKTLAGGQSRVVSLTVQTISGDAGTYDATVETANDSATTSVTVTEPGVSGTVEGTVVNVSSGNGIDGATVSAGSQSTTTSADGTYTLTLETGDYTVEASAQGYNTSSQDVTVTDGGTTTANFHLQSTDSGTPEYQSFTAYAEDGYLQVGNNSLRSDLPDCPNGVPENESKGCVRFTADLNPETGDYTVEPENFHFPSIPFEDTTLGTVPVNNTASDTITGNLDLESGDGSFNAPILAYLEDSSLDDTCSLEVSVEGTTGESGNLTGDPGVIQPNGTAHATVVDGSFSIPEATFEDCGPKTVSVNSDVGLPAGSGKNELVQELYIEFHEESVSEVTSGN